MSVISVRCTVNRVGLRNILLSKENFYLSIPHLSISPFIIVITYPFPTSHLSICFYERGISDLPISHLPISPFIMFQVNFYQQVFLNICFEKMRIRKTSSFSYSSAEGFALSVSGSSNELFSSLLTAEAAIIAALSVQKRFSGKKTSMPFSLDLFSKYSLI